MVLYSRISAVPFRYLSAKLEWIVEPWTPTVLPLRIAFEASIAFSAAACWVPRLIGLARARHLGERRDLGDQEAVGAVRVGTGEVDHLLALVGDAHAGHDGVVLLGGQRRDDAVPVLGHDLALHLHARAQVVGEVDLEAFELAAGAREVPRRIGALRGDLDRSSAWAAAPPMARAEPRRAKPTVLTKFIVVPLFVGPA